ncbi:MAG: cobalamin-independent methionine synthase II family protein [Chloroflexi bacterium]|nr:cobalamin-independent methionine synthase II family protein [Chloroflexota bacterium]
MERESTGPSIRTTVVGSYPVPAWLAAAPTAPNLRDALLVVLKTQELAGIDVASDGELSRFDINHPATNGMIDYFVRPLQGIETRLGRADVAAFRALPGMTFRARPAGVVRGPLGEGTLDLPGAWEAVRPLAARRCKFTLTSPYMLAKTLLDRHYGDVRALTEALADVLAAQVAAIDAPVVQIDEAHLTGHPEDGAWAPEPINRVLRAVGPGQERALHLCFGNYGGQTIQQGFWRDLLPFLNALEVDHLVLETARRPEGELDVLRDLRPGIALGVGVIDIKDNEVETPDLVARRIEAAVRVLGPERVRWVHPDCGFWMLPRPVADGKMRALVRGRDLFLGGS